MFSGSHKLDFPKQQIRYHIKLGDEIVALTVHICQDEQEIIEATKNFKFDTLLLAYSINDIASLTNCKEKWFPMKKYCSSKVKTFLVGTHLDAIEDPALKKICVTHKQGSQLSSTIGAKSYYECSGIKLTGVSRMFTEIARTALPKHVLTKTTTSTSSSSSSSNDTTYSRSTSKSSKQCTIQ